MNARIVWAGNNGDVRPFRVIALLGSDTLPMGQYASKARAIRRARRLLREGWASVRVEDVRVMK